MQVMFPVDSLEDIELVARQLREPLCARGEYMSSMFHSYSCYINVASGLQPVTYVHDDTTITQITSSAKSHQIPWKTTMAFLWFSYSFWICRSFSYSFPMVFLGFS